MLVEHGVPAAGEDIPVPRRGGGPARHARRRPRRPGPAAARARAERRPARRRADRARGRASRTPSTPRRASEGAVSHPLLAAAAANARARAERRDARALAAASPTTSCASCTSRAPPERTPSSRRRSARRRRGRRRAARGTRPPARRARAAADTAAVAGARRAAAELASYYERAGEKRHLTDVLEPAVDSTARGASARACVLLSDGAGPRTVWGRRAASDRALAESRDDPRSARTCSPRRRQRRRQLGRAAHRRRGVGARRAVGGRRRARHRAARAVRSAGAGASKRRVDRRVVRALGGDVGHVLLHHDLAERWPASGSYGAVSWTARGRR